MNGVREVMLLQLDEGNNEDLHWNHEEEKL